MKKIVSLTLGISFLIMTYTGIMLFICPHGRVAYWNDWRLLGLSKTQYGDLHSTAMVVFVLFGVWHIYYNWKPLVSYLKDKAHKISFTKKEFLAALAINAVVVAGTLLAIQPFKGFVDWGESIKSSWTKSLGEPPYGHAEESTLSTLCRREGIDEAEALKLLRQKGIAVQKNQTIEEIAKAHGLIPKDLYEIILPAKDPQTGDRPPSGLGRKNLRDLGAYGIDGAKALSYLRSKGIEAIDEQTPLREIAAKLGTTPYELYEELKKVK